MENKTERIFYLDVLRAIAILCVILLHVTGHLSEMMNYNLVSIYSVNGVFETFANNFFRIGIALFLMLSGALLLGREWDVRSFYTKRLTRIAKPFLFWALIFSVILISASYFIPSIGFVKHFAIHDMVGVFVDTLLCKAPGSAVYWFFWMMLAMYIIMPFFNKWINNTDFVKIEGFLVIWIIYNILAYTLMLPIPEMLSFVISPIGFVVLGYYLRYNERKIFKSTRFSVILILAPAIFMLVYSYGVVDSKILFIFHRYSFPVMVEAIGVFCLFKTSVFINGLPNTLKKFILSVSLCSYGMYLIHSQIIMVFRKILHVSFDFYSTYIILFVVGFILSWFIIYILSKIPIVEDYIGVK